MKTLPLSEVLKLATPGPYEIRVSEPWRVYSKNAQSMVLSGFGRGDEPKTNVALAVHSMNVRDELIEALDELFEDWTTLVGQDLRENNADVAKLWKKSEAVLAKARAVEMPKWRAGWRAGRKPNE